MKRMAVEASICDRNLVLGWSSVFLLFVHRFAP